MARTSLIEGTGLAVFQCSARGDLCQVRSTVHSCTDRRSSTLVGLSNDLLKYRGPFGRGCKGTRCSNVACSVDNSVVGGRRILSKHQLTNYLWVDVVALTVPLFLASYFKDRVVSLGAYVYVAGLTVILGLAALFGM